ncbi:MAG: hypothetical protein ACRENB_09280 [Gemmatimonadales bacterium]
MTGLIAGILLASAPAPVQGGTCNEHCQWNVFLGLKGYACVMGTEGTYCTSWGYVCSIITSCRRTMLLRPDGSVLAVIRTCGRATAPLRAT